ncbi:MAG TPA: hybrid sensor histidine kinase/response regulator, partial [Tepidisphaeraceae bacterium]
LRTPLTPILAAVSFLESYEDLPDEVREEIVSIRRNTEHEARLVEDLLNFMKLARGKIELHQEAVDAHALVRTVLTQFQNDIDAKEVQLSTALRARQHYIWADPTRVRQVLTNLVDNAIKFSHRGGEISVQSSNVNGRFHVEVIDGGIGIEPEVQARLFNPFEQGEQTISRRYGGLGLGLAISKGIIDLHGGKLSCRSAGRGTGASFIVELDVVPVVSEDALPPPAVPPANGSLRVLLVEDHHDTLRVMSKLLRALGYSVIGATTVAAAVELADREAFDVLVSDIGLPDGTGMDLLRKIKSKRPFKAVAVSGFGQEEDRIRSKQAGFLEHLTKPVDFQRLQAVLKQMQNVS